MLRFKVRPFVEANRLIQMLLYAVRDPDVHSFQPETRAHILRSLDTLITQLEELALPLSMKSASQLRELLQTAQKPSELQWVTDQLSGRIIDEVETSYLLYLSPVEAALYEPSSPLFGANFDTKFPTQGAFELDEAAKCMALGRPTAAVFHLMRVMEVGIRATARCLGIPDPLKPSDRSWGPILKTIRGAIDAKWPTVASRAHGEGALFDSL